MNIDLFTLREVGLEMFAWLNTANALKRWKQGAERILQIMPDDESDAELAAALVEAPWELLCDTDFLAAHKTVLSVVSRQVVPATKP